MNRIRLPAYIVVPLEQAVYAATNMLPLIPLSQILDERDFGLVALGHSLVLGAVVLGRAYFATPFLSHQQPVGPRSKTFFALASRAVLAATATACALVLVSGIDAVPLASASSMLLLVAGLPAAVVVDMYRMSFIRAGVPERALLADGVWLLVELGIVAALWTIAGSQEFAATAMWSAGAIVTACSAAFLSRRAGDGSDVQLAELIGLGRGFLAEAALLVVRLQGYFVALAVIAGPNVLGGVRLSFTLAGPLNMVLAGWRTYSTSRFRSAPLLTGPTLRTALPPAVLSAAALLVVVLTPDSVWDAISGNVDAAPFVAVVTAAVAFSAIDVVAQGWLAANGDTQRLWQARVVEVIGWLGLVVLLQPTTIGVVRTHILIAALVGTTGWAYALVRARRHDRLR